MSSVKSGVLLKTSEPATGLLMSGKEGGQYTVDLQSISK